VRHLLAFAAAWFAPAAVLGTVLAATGQNPAWALAYGFPGLLGAAVYLIVVRALDRRARTQGFDEELAAHYLSTPAAVVHPEASRLVRAEGLHADLDEDERRRKH
jgi:hypothetical protein